MLTYRQILKKAWQIAWQNPALWFFGFFVAFVGSVGEIEIFLRSISLEPEEGILQALLSGFIEGGLFTLGGLKGLLAALTTRPISLFIALLLLMIILGGSAFFIWLIVVSQGALVNGVVGVLKAKKTSWLENFSFGLSKFWPILILSILLKVILWGLFIVLGFFAALKFTGSVFLFIPAFVIFISLVVTLSFVIKYAIFGVILKNHSVGDSLNSALNLFYKNWLLSLEVAFILFLIFLVANSFLVFLVGLIFSYILKLFSDFSFLILLVLIIFAFIFIAIQILLTIFHWAAWILVFEVLTSKKAILVSRLISGFKRIFG